MAVTHLVGDLHEIVVPPRRVFVHEPDDPGGVTLVDAGDTDTAEAMIAHLRESFGPVDRVYLTHSGGDHYRGLDAVVDAFDPEIYAAADEHELLEAIEYEPAVLFEDGDVLPGGVEVIQVPGHSPAPSAMLVRDERALISGDVLDGADRRGLPAGYLLPPPELHNWDHAEAERGLSRLLEYDFESVYVYHGSHAPHDAKDKLDRYVNFKERHTDRP